MAYNIKQKCCWKIYLFRILPAPNIYFYHKVCFLNNADILGYGNDNEINFIDFLFNKIRILLFLGHNLQIRNVLAKKDN